MLLAVLYTALLYIAFLNRGPLLDWLHQSDYNQLPAMFLLSILFSIIPIVPYTVFAGVMGAKYGVFIGSFVNWVGSVGAAFFFFVSVRYFFFDPFRNFIRRYEKVETFDEMIGRNGFIAVLFGRLLPMIPTPVVNLYSGLSSITFRQYMLATAIGQIPNVVIYAYLGNQLFTSIQAAALGVFLYASFLLVILSLYYWWYKSSGVRE